MRSGVTAIPPILLASKFPAFDSRWPPEVQLSWFKAFLLLMDKVLPPRTPAP